MMLFFIRIFLYLHESVTQNEDLFLDLNTSNTWYFYVFAEVSFTCRMYCVRVVPIIIIGHGQLSFHCPFTSAFVEQGGEMKWY